VFNLNASRTTVRFAPRWFAAFTQHIRDINLSSAFAVFALYVIIASSLAFVAREVHVVQRSPGAVASATITLDFRAATVAGMASCFHGWTYLKLSVSP